MENKLIAEFMGYPKVANDEDKRDYLEDCVKYHTSWDWLMPVVEKILDISFQDEGDAEDFYSIRDCIPDRNHTHKAVIEFIKYYNQNEPCNRCNGKMRIEDYENGDRYSEDGKMPCPNCQE